ncbi:hypothetical protein CDAR_494661 [Caerostris darwini]|uniref:Uncharacterized protein n=1 Tax=Caerostris darwini TaxID=1538125 RepID=A0AAV4UDE9_9ARAC|nr:hypothetical protein CDAR_494661 [Caerostris darwini]
MKTISCGIPCPSQQYNFSQDIHVEPFNNVTKSYKHSYSSNDEHKISRSDLKADMHYPQYHSAISSLQQVNSDCNCESSVKYEARSSNISSDIPYPSEQYKFSQDINVGSFMNVSKSYEHGQRSSMIAETLNNFGLADGSSLNTNYAVQSSADCHFKSFITRHHLKKPFI